MTKIEKIIGLVLFLVIIGFQAYSLRQKNLGTAINWTESRTDEIVPFTRPVSIDGFLYLTGNFVQGGQIATKTQTGTTTTATASEICDNSVINLSITNATGTNTFTLPTSASLTADCLRVNGQHKQVFIRNVASGGGLVTSTTMVAGIGMDLQIPEATGADTALNATSTMIMDFVRLSATSVWVDILETIDGD